jgi:hypothetical protein
VSSIFQKGENELLLGLSIEAYAYSLASLTYDSQLASQSFSSQLTIHNFMQKFCSAKLLHETQFTIIYPLAIILVRQ